MNSAGIGSILASSYTYTNDGLPLTRTDGNRIVTTYAYDALNRLIGETHSGTGSTNSASITRCYDGTNYVERGNVQGATESIYSEVRRVKYTAGGFRSTGNFITALWFHCGGLVTPEGMDLDVAA